MSLESLQDLARKWGLDASSPDIPGLTVPEIWSNSKTKKPKAIPWAMREKEGENIGMGIFPIIECISTQDVIPVPTREAVEREMTALLGKFSPTVQVSKTGDLDNLITAKHPPAEGERTKVNFSWPNYKVTSTLFSVCSL